MTPRGWSTDPGTETVGRVLGLRAPPAPFLSFFALFALFAFVGLAVAFAFFPRELYGTEVVSEPWVVHHPQRLVETQAHDVEQRVVFVVGYPLEWLAIIIPA